MSWLIREGNLAETPILREGENGRPYCYAAVLVTDRARQEGGTYTDVGPVIRYDVSVSGSQAKNLVDAAKEGGNINVLFAGDYDVVHSGENNEYVKHRVRAAHIAVSLRTQTVRVHKG